MKPRVLPPGEIHLWWLRRGTQSDALYWKWLLPAEQARADAMIRNSRREEWLAGRALLRACLSQYTGVEPRALPLASSDAGKPQLDLPGAPAFNLSHGGSWIVCAVAQAEAIGIDIDSSARRNDTAAIAARYFHQAEQQALVASADAQQEFFFHWTLKEAYIKALGRTIASTPLDSLPFARDGAEVRPLFAPPAGHWLFRHVYFDGDHQLALACRWPQCDTGSQPVRCRSWRWDPATGALQEYADEWPC